MNALDGNEGLVGVRGSGRGEKCDNVLTYRRRNEI